MIALLRRRRDARRRVVDEYEESRKAVFAEDGRVSATVDALLAFRVVLDEQFDAQGVPR